VSTNFSYLSSIDYKNLKNSINQINSKIGPRPIILDENYKALAIINNIINAELNQELNSIDEFSFSISYNDPKKEFLKNENLIQMFDTIYIIREITKIKNSSELTLEVYSEALWYDIQFTDPLTVISWTKKTANQMIKDILSKTDWTIGTIDFTNSKTLTLDENNINPLSALYEVKNLFDGNLVFDTNNKTVSLLKENEKHSGASIIYKKNIESIEAKYDTKDLTTKLYIYGKDNLSIDSINEGKKYLENYTYTSKKRVKVLKDERFTDKYHLLEYGYQQLEKLSKPKISYKTTALNLKSLSGLSHEQFSIGSIIRVYDKELNLDINTKITKWVYNIVEPWNTKIELEISDESVSSFLSENLNSENYNNENLETSSGFNLLMNSRADDGFAYWENDGFEIDDQIGLTGWSSFKTIIGSDKIKTLSQTIYPSTRENYTVSGYLSLPDDYIYNSSAKIGIELTINYEDGTNEVIYIPFLGQGAENNE